MQKVAGLLFALLIAGIATWCLLRYLRFRNAAREAPGWPRAMARIAKSQVHEVISRYGGKRWQVELEYHFHWEGETHKGHLVSFADPPMTRAGAYRIVQTYREGEEYPVHVNRRRPAHSVLELAEPGTGLLILALCLFAGAAIPLGATLAF